MAITKRIVCLANSRKLNGRCIAGIEVAEKDTIRWIRPVSTREHGEVSEYERQYKDGSDPRVLDVIDVPLMHARPEGYQQENWVLDPGYYWSKVGRSTWRDLEKLTDNTNPLWINGHNTYNGLNDKVPLAIAASLRSSLRLISVDGLTLSVFSPGEAFGNSKRRVQGRFLYNNQNYWLWVTDPDYERKYLVKPDGDYEVGKSFLVISLGEPYNDFCYKLIAAIISRDGGIGI